MTFKPARLLLAILAFAAVPAMAQVAATVNGKPIPSARIDSILKDYEDNGQKLPPDARQQITDKVIGIEILAQEAEKRGLDKSPTFKEKMALARSQALASALYQSQLASVKISDADISAEYDKVKAAAAQRQEYHALHILVKTEDEAKDIVTKLKNGAKFEDLAKEKSQDPGTATKGGDLDWATPDNYAPEFSAAMVKLDNGQFTDTPVHTQFGWHVIKLVEKRSGQVPPLEDVKTRIAEMLKNKQMDDFVNGLKARAKVVAGGAAAPAADAPAKKAKK